MIKVQTNRTPNLWRIQNSAISLVLAAALVLPVGGGKAEAGKEGVFLNSDVYYTLEKAQLSSGNEKSSLRFMVELVNNSDVSVDMNQYGIAVLDPNGNRYGAELTEKISSRVAAHSSKPVSYSAKLPANLSLDQLKVEIYAWDMKAMGFTRTIGALSVSSAAETGRTTKPSAIVSLQDIDNTYASDAMVNIELQHAYHAYAKGNWNVYAELSVENLGTASFKLPSGLQTGLKNAEGLAFGGSVVYGADTVLLPHQKAAVVLEFPVGDLSLDGALNIEFSKKASSSPTASTTATSGNTANGSGGASNGGSAAASSTQGSTVLESMAVGGFITPFEQGQSQSNAAGRTGLTAAADSVSATSRADGIHVESVCTLTNNGSQPISVPSLTAFYQSRGSTLTVSAEDTASHPEFLAPGESTSYYYNGVLPVGITMSTVQLVVMETKASAVSVPVFVANVPTESSNGAGPVEAGSTTYATSAGKLDIRLNASYRLKTDSGDDIIMSELQVKNPQSEAVKLPAMYGGYYDGKNTVDATVKYVQSSAYINAGQMATLYVFSTVPYDMLLSSGKLLLGEGVESGGQLSKKKEWMRVDYTLRDEAIAQVTVNNTWMVSDPSRISVGSIVESKVYSSLTPGDSSVTAVVRINQKNLMSRSGNVVPYVGYIETSNGEVYGLTASNPAGKLNKDGQAMTTLYAKLPFGILDKNAMVVFGPQIKENIFAPAQKYKFAVSSNQPGSLNGETWVINESVYPYNVKIGAVSRTYASSGYFFNFRYMLDKLSSTQTTSDNRTLYFELEDAEDTVVKTFEVPFEGTGAFESSDDTTVYQSLKVAPSEIKNLDTFSKGNRIKVYEKFQGAVRYIGELTYNLD